MGVLGVSGLGGFFSRRGAVLLPACTSLNNVSPYTKSQFGLVVRNTPVSGAAGPTMSTSCSKIMVKKHAFTVRQTFERDSCDSDDHTEQPFQPLMVLYQEALKITWG